MRKPITLLLAGLALAGTASFADPVEWPVAEGGNGHFYEAFSVSDGITWTEANVAAT